MTLTAETDCGCGRVTRPGVEYVPGDCHVCWSWTDPGPRGRAFRAGRAVAIARAKAAAGPADPPAPPAPVCLFRGDEFTGAEREARGLPHNRTWFRCAAGVDHRGGAVCPCLGCGAGCPQYAPAADPPPPAVGPQGVALDNGGIGDALCAVLLAAGLGPDTPLVVPADRLPWVRLFWPNASAGPAKTGDRLVRLVDYQFRHAGPRWKWWADRLDTVARLPGPVPLPADALAWAVPLAGRVVLSPFAAASGRTWPLDCWRAVEAALAARGVSSVVLDDGEHADRTAGFRGVVLRGESAPRVAAVIRQAACLAGNDSGMVHVAGFSRTPAVAVCSTMSDRGIFDVYPTVRQLGGQGGGFLRVSPDDVVDAVLGQLRGSLGDFPADDFAAILHERDRDRLWHWLTIYPALWRAVREINPKGIVEIGTRAGYSAWTMLRACPDATVEGFDLDCDRHGGFRGAHEHARAVLPADRFKLTIADSHGLERLPACDVAFIDGDHTEAGALADLELAARSGARVILLDDVTNLEDVRRAGDRFCRARGLTPRFLPSRTGLYRIDP